MYKGLPSLTRCCFCVPLRPGLLVWAYVKLVFNTIVFGLGLIWLSIIGIFTDLDLSKEQIYGFILFVSVLILCLSDIIFNIVLVVAAHKRNTSLLCHFYRYAIVHAFFFLTLGALIIALVITVIGADNDEIGRIVGVFSALYCIFIIIYAYQLLLVRSAVVKLNPDGQIHFLNHSTNPKCYMKVVGSKGDKSKDTSTENQAF